VPPADRARMHFVRTLLRGGEALCGKDGVFRTTSAGRAAALPARDVAALVSAGTLAGNGRTCRVSPEATGWLRRCLAGADGQLAQHRETVSRADGSVINLTESPLARLAVAAAGETSPFLAGHQVEAGERLRRLIERAQLRQRVTMSYDGSSTASGKGGQNAGEISDMAADARRAVSKALASLPRDCGDIALEVCGFLKGLQQIESERGWPRRSAKLVLRIGLDQLASYWGLAPVAAAPSRGKISSWMDIGGRPELLRPSISGIGPEASPQSKPSGESPRPAPGLRSECD
jgi:hypothetical protein